MAKWTWNTEMKNELILQRTSSRKSSRKKTTLLKSSDTEDREDLWASKWDSQIGRGKKKSRRVSIWRNIAYNVLTVFLNKGPKRRSEGRHVCRHILVQAKMIKLKEEILKASMEKEITFLLKKKKSDWHQDFFISNTIYKNTQRSIFKKLNGEKET